MPLLGDLAELVTDEGYAAEFFDPTDVHDLSIAIEKVLVDDEYRQTLAQQNHNAANAYPMTKIADMYLDTFNDVIMSKKKRTFSLNY